MASKSDKARIAIVEDQLPYLEQLIECLQARRGWRIVARCTHASQALRDIPGSGPDLILLDLALPDGPGADLIPRLRERLPRVPIVVLTVQDRAAAIVQAIQAGAAGYLLKRDAGELISGVEDALEGRASVMSPAVARRLWELARSTPAVPVTSHSLTRREAEILRLAARGQQQAEIGQALGIALNTVKNHTRNIYEKLGVNTLIEAVIRLKGGKGLLDE